VKSGLIFQLCKIFSHGISRMNHGWKLPGAPHFLIWFFSVFLRSQNWFFLSVRLSVSQINFASFLFTEDPEQYFENGIDS
jgi:hypothetical protein